MQPSREKTNHNCPNSRAAASARLVQSLTVISLDTEQTSRQRSVLNKIKLSKSGVGES